MPKVAEVTGSEKSPPGGETLGEKIWESSKRLRVQDAYAPTMETVPCRAGFPIHTTLPARS